MSGENGHVNSLNTYVIKVQGCRQDNGKTRFIICDIFLCEEHQGV